MLKNDAFGASMVFKSNQIYSSTGENNTEEKYNT